MKDKALACQVTRLGAGPMIERDDRRTLAGATVLNRARSGATSSVCLAADLKLPLDVVTETVGILARKRAGKSYAARKFVEQLLEAGLQVVVVDPKGDWWGLRSSADGKQPGFPILIAGGERGDVPLEAGAGESLGRFVVEERVSLLLDLSLFRKHEVATFMTGFLETIYRLKAREAYRTPMMLVIDEADAVAPQRPQKGEERMLGAAEDIVRRGGQRGIGCTMISQRAAVLNKNVLTQILVLVVLRTVGPQDLAALDEWIRLHGTAEQRGILMESLPALPVGTAWVWSPGWPSVEGIFRQIKIAPIETFDSGATPRVGQKIEPPKTLADVDLSALKELLASSIEKTQSNDPRALQQRIAELERQLQRRPTEVRVERVDVPVVKPEEVAELHELAGAMHDLVERFGFSYRSLVERLAGLQAGATVNQTRHEPVHVITEGDLGSVKARRRRHAPSRPTTSASVKGADGGADDAELSGPQQRILDTLASFEAVGLAHVARGNVAVFSRQSPTSSGFTNNLGTLRSRGLIDYPTGGRVELTDAGRALARPAEQISSLEELHQAWFARLSGPQVRILEVLIARYPQPIGRDELAKASHQSPTSSGYTNNLGALRSLGLLDYPRPREIVATPLLFPAELHKERYSGKSSKIER